MSSLLVPVLPVASSMTVADLAQFGAHLVEWASHADDVAEVRDMAAKWAAITEYVRRSSREGIAEAEGALRRLEQRVGALLGPATPNGKGVGSVATDPSISKDARSEFRLMAEHPDIVEQVIAESTDASPPSRAKCMGAIRNHLGATERKAADDELDEWVESLDIKPDPERDARNRRQHEVMAELRGTIAEVNTFAGRFTIDDVNACSNHRLFPITMSDLEGAAAFLADLHASACTGANQ